MRRSAQYASDNKRFHADVRIDVVLNPVDDRQLFRLDQRVQIFNRVVPHPGGVEPFHQLERLKPLHRA